MITKEELQMTSPLRVLLDLIEKEHLEITEVSLTRVTGQYLSFLKTFDHVPAVILADFLTVASRLVLLKSRSLTSLPKDDDAMEEPLLEQLKLYKEFRGAAQGLGELAERNGSSYAHTMRWGEFVTFSMPPELKPGMLRDAIAQVLEDIAAWDILPEESIHDRISIREKIDELRTALQTHATFALHEQANDDNDPLHILVGFLALLEMVRQSEARATQTSIGGNITVERSVYE